MAKKVKITSPLAIVICLILACLGCSGKYFSVEANVNLNTYQNIYLGWIDMNEDYWGELFYSSKESWIKAMGLLNAGFYVRIRDEYFPNKTVVYPSYDKRLDLEKINKGLYIKFSDVRIEPQNYYLILTLTFIDLETQKILFKIPKKYFYGDAYGLENMLYYALDEVARLIYAEVLAFTD